MQDAATRASIDFKRLWRVRRTVLEMLKDRGYAVLLTELDAWKTLEALTAQLSDFKNKRNGLTTLRQRVDDPNDQVYVFFIGRQGGRAINVDMMMPRILVAKKDNVSRVILVVQTGITPNAKKFIREGKRDPCIKVEAFNENDLLFNITHHAFVPRHVPLSQQEKVAMLRRYRLKESQLPRIQQKDPVARYFGLEHGDIVKIIRPSGIAANAIPSSAARSVTYRLCIR